MQSNARGWLQFDDRAARQLSSLCRIRDISLRSEGVFPKGGAIGKPCKAKQSVKHSKPLYVPLFSSILASLCRNGSRNGTVTKNVSTSAMGWQISTPDRPNSRGRVRMSGIKNTP